ncbi:major capsid protein [Paludibacterium denitrificans]|uniref:Phage-related membrane protein n=1 Tax=Paludibacterium denitrificans TaxID=2675226 RepID=A0A844GF14_9NEIS|nr:major capsid protein [Paludibacterium denitrificans]MTD33910.1 hypothetical protein [Paludibacterium denitrificans]
MKLINAARRFASRIPARFAAPVAIGAFASSAFADGLPAIDVSTITAYIATIVAAVGAIGLAWLAVKAAAAGFRAVRQSI